MLMRKVPHNWYRAPEYRRGGAKVFCMEMKFLLRDSSCDLTVWKLRIILMFLLILATISLIFFLILHYFLVEI